VKELLRIIRKLHLPQLLFFASALWFFPLSAGPDQGAILLLNDSPFILTATIQASDGTFLGEFTIQPGQQKNFTQNLSPTITQRPGTPDVSLTPYRVIWQCASQSYYGTCYSVSPGSLVRASECQGPHYCSPKPEDKKEPASTLQKKK
jgi:hypothetical protein